MYQFRINAVTKPGETIALVGSVPEMGSWDVTRCVRLQTSPERYPLWWVDLELNHHTVGQEGDRNGEFNPIPQPRAPIQICANSRRSLCGLGGVG
ncbi:hypothetical protein HC928_05495 [bacterium]|nr:hypothetical protein [bacterium]